ncbi:LamD-like [Gordonia phage Eyes]|nr:LamD-like [Gordonia phage Eyes]
MAGIGDLIITARRAASLTQEELATRLGITQAALSRYENDLREPDAEMLARLSRALGLSTDFLSHDFRLRGALAADAHMRRQKTTKVSEWKTAEARLNLYRMRSSYLLSRITIHPENRVPTFDPEDTSPTDAARLLRAQWKMPVGAVKNLTRWIESAGVVVIEEDFGTRRIDGLSQWAADYPVIMINSGLPPDRKRLTLAHELGHLVLHTEFVDDDIEDQANEFAAELLMPEHVIAPDLVNLTPAKLLALKAVWGVSMQAIFERAYRMGKVSKDDRGKFYRTMNSRGWRRAEPGDDRVPVETPELARSLGEALLNRGGMSRDEVARLTGRSTADGEGVFLPADRRLRSI